MPRPPRSELRIEFSALQALNNLLADLLSEHIVSVLWGGFANHPLVDGVAATAIVPITVCLK